MTSTHARFDRSGRRLRLAIAGLVAAGFGIGRQPVAFAQTVDCPYPEQTTDHKLPGDTVAHTTDMSASRVPFFRNAENPTTHVRPYNLSNGDPCAARSFIEPDGNGKWRWVTQRTGGTGFPDALPPSACYNDLVHMPWAATRDQIQTVVILDDQGNPLQGGDGHYQYYGFRLGANLARPLSIGDFVAPAPTLGKSSLCLLPPNLAGQSTGWMSLSRPTVENRVDLITGLPLVQVTDLELPFEGATFRLTRTRSFQRSRTADAWTQWHSSGADDWWDWTGLGWMASENPFLLIDSALADVEGNNPRTTRLVLDAHQSIPFQLIEADGRYEAPPRFRATLRHNGVWNTSLHSWATSPGHESCHPPTEYDITLYDGAVRYSFVAIYEDVPPNKYDSAYTSTGTSNPNGPDTPSSYHDRPYTPNQFRDQGIPDTDLRFVHRPNVNGQNPGFGLPYHGICKQITDQYGHIALMEYSDATRKHMDDPTTADCIECQQDGLAKGQLKWIKLGTQHGTQTTWEWTLLYAHRRFAGLRWGITDQQGTYAYDSITSKCPDEDPGRYELHGYNAIDRIYVYPGDLGTSVDLAQVDLTIPHTDAPGFDTDFSDANLNDPVHKYNAAHSGATIPTTWSYQVRYHYDYWQPNPGFPSPFLGLDTHGTFPNSAYPWLYGMGDNRAKSPPVLMMTTVASRPGGTGAPSTKRQVYSYSNYPLGFNGTDPFPEDFQGIPWLNAIFSDEDITRVLGVTQFATGVPNPLSLKLLALHRDGGAGLDSGIFDDYIKAYASVLIDQPYAADQWPDTGGASWRPSAHAMVENGFLLLPPEDFLSDCPAETVGDLTCRGSDGAQHHYRFHRLLKMPLGGTHAGGTTFPALEGYFLGTDMPMASRWFIPYAWQGYIPNCSTSYPGNLQLASMPAMDEPRFVVFVDEFASRKEMIDGSQQYNGDTGVKPGQISRHMYEINPSGVVLRERTWQFTPQGTTMAGSGLGEEYIYKSIYNYFHGTGSEFETCPPMSNPNGPGCNDPNIPTPQMGGELLLVQQRSVGWSAASQANSGYDPDTTGLVKFFDYQMFGPGSGSTPIPWRTRIQLVDEGIQKGKGTSPPVKLYTRQIFRDPASPTEVLCEVKFNSDSPTLLITAPSYPPAAGSGSLPTNQISHFHRETVPTGDPDAPDRVVGRTVVQAPTQQRPGGDWYYPVEREVYDDQGNMPWEASGLLRHAGDPASDAADPLSSLTFTYYQKDGGGRTLASVMDVGNPQSTNPISGPNGDVYISMAFPEAWPRIPAPTLQAPALQYVTQWVYDQDGVRDIFFPSGQRFARRWVTHHPSENAEDDWCEEFLFNNLRLLTPQQGEQGDRFSTQSPGERHEYNGPRPDGSPRKAEHGVFTQSRIDIVLIGQTPTTGSTVPTFSAFAAVQILPDANGRPAKATLLEHNASGALEPVGSKEVNELVDVRREKEIWDNITRTTRSLIGQHMRTYAGTNDDAWEGDRALRDSSTGQYYKMDGNNVIPCPDHDMVILERLEYGTGPTDAWLPTIHRRYTHHPSWADAFYELPPTADTEGFASVTHYDWRMRPVRSDVYDRGDPVTGTPARLATTLNFLDAAGRVYLMVTYGRGSGMPNLGTAGLDPSLRRGDELPATAEAFFAMTASQSSLAPASIVATVYSPTGQVIESHNYDMSWAYQSSGACPYQAEKHGYGAGDVEVFSQRPGAPITVVTLDAVGRTRSSASVAPGRGSGPYTYELSRTDYVFDGGGNVIESSQFERISEASDVLDASSGSGANAVRTRSLSWYDTEKRKTVSVALGTEQAAGFVAGDAVYDRPAHENTPPALNTTIGVGANLSYVLNGVPTSAIVSVSVFDLHNGDLQYTVSPSCLVTEYQYDLNNRLVSTITNATASAAQDRRVTDRSYQFGRLIGLTARPMPYSPTDPVELQATSVLYQAEVVDDQFHVVSHNNALIGKMFLPDPHANASSAQPSVRLRYNFAGQIAERTDARGVTFRYQYDGLERLLSVEVGSYDSGGTIYSAGIPSSLDPPTGLVPSNRIGFVEYVYDDNGRLRDIIARPAAGGTPIAFNRLEHDAHDNVSMEWQVRGGSPTSGSPKIDYTWDFQATGSAADATGRNRLTAMDYPVQAAQARRTVTLGFGQTTSLEYQFSRTASLTTNLTPTAIADFTYAGSGRRSSTSFGGGAIQSKLDTASSVGLEGLDQHGRTVDLIYRDGPSTSDATLYAAHYGYDAAGNRKSALLTQVNEPGVAGYNSRSQVNDYNTLGQLTGTQVGTLIQASGTIDPAATKRTDQWNLDVLGNWNGNGTDAFGHPVPGRTTQLISGQGAPLTKTIFDGTDNQNRINTRTVDTGSNSPPPPTYLSYDANGNLACDGTYYYQYDPWNRLIQVNRAVQHSVTTPVTASDGHTQLYYVWWPGVMLKHYVYDGRGRLIETQSPFPNPDVVNPGLRSEQFYYDGIRRIQEVVTDPLLAVADASASNDVNVIAAANAAQASSPQPLDGSSAPVAFEEAQKAAPVPQVTTYLDREYVWGPGDKGVDELLVQYDRYRKPWWTVQDDGGDVVAVCDTDPTTLRGRVTAQWTYDAYGDATSTTILMATSALRCGHKALFVDRLDVGVTGSGYSESPRIVPFAQTICHVRNRVYAPQLGRFLQPDPNETGQTLMAEASVSGMGIGAIAIAFSMEQHFAEGMNAYEYLGSKPWNRSDPLGLSWDPFSLVDDFVAEMVGSTAAFMERLSSGIKVAAYVGAVLISQLPFPVGSIAADLGASMLEGGMPPELIKLRKYLGYVALGALVVTAGQLLFHASTAAAQYLIKYGLRGAFKNMWNAVRSLARKVWGWFKRKEESRGACCFAAGTVVWTATGLVPIERVCTGDFVLARDEHTSLLVYEPVVTAFRIEDAALLEITIRNENGMYQTLQTTDEHPFFVARRGWTRADGLRPGDEVNTVGTSSTITALRFLSGRTTVYDLVVRGSHNFHVGTDGVLVHNCYTMADHLTETGGAMLRGKSPHMAESTLDELRALKWKEEGVASGKQGAFKLTDPDLPGRQLRFDPGGTRFDALHNYGKPYWVWSDGKQMIKWEATLE